MTLICWDGRCVAADGLYAYNNMRASGSLYKLRRKGARVYGFTGSTALFDPMIAWFEAGHKPEDIPKVGEDHKDSRLLVFEDNQCTSYKIELPYPEPCFAPDAWGCAAEYAIGCMDAGAGPERTVELAIVRDKNIGGPIQVVDLNSLDDIKPIPPESLAEMRQLAKEVDLENAIRLLEEAGYDVSRSAA